VQLLSHEGEVTREIERTSMKQRCEGLRENLPMLGGRTNREQEEPYSKFSVKCGITTPSVLMRARRDRDDVPYFGFWHILGSATHPLLVVLCERATNDEGTC
jgi:hypothetical protein